MSNQRLRVRFHKLGKIRFTSHRDVARIWERALRRAGVQVAYTEGFSPRPKLSFGLALPTGYESLSEYLDINLRADDGISTVANRDGDWMDAVNAALPEGMEAQVAVPLESGAVSLQQAVTSCTWQIELPDGLSGTDAALATERALAAQQIFITRQRKGQETTDDIRSAILSLHVAGTALEAELATQPRALRPAELLSALAPGMVPVRVVRTHQWTQASGARREVLPLRQEATQAAHAWRRAS